AGPPGASGDTARPNYMGPSGNGLVEADERRAKNLRDQGRSVKAAPVRFQKAVSRSKENAAVERREARRSASWAGSPSRWRDRPDREAGHGVRRSAPAPFGAPLPHVWGARKCRRTPRLARTGAAEL